MAEIKELLDDVIEKEVRTLNSLTDDEEKERVINNLTQLHKLRIEEIKAETDAEDKYEHRKIEIDKIDSDYVFAKQQVKDNKIDRCIKTATAVLEIGIPLIFYGVWMNKGFKFEETGSFTSTTFKNLLNRFRPTK